MLMWQHQEAQVQARQGPAALPAEFSAGRGARASSASMREIESREFGDMGARHQSAAHRLLQSCTPKLLSVSGHSSFSVASHCTAGADTVAATCLAGCAHVAENCAGVMRSDNTGTDDAVST